MLQRAGDTLAQAARGAAILKYHGELCLSLVGVAAVPALVALALGDYAFALRAGLPAVALAAAGALLSRIEAPKRIQANESLIIIALAYLQTALLMSWPLAGDGVAWLDALFHAVSGVTTTGLSTLGGIEARSPAFHFAQAWMQWYGGLVIVVLAVFLVGQGLAARRLSADELSDVDRISGTRAQARSILAVYAILTALAALAFMGFGLQPYDALLHALTTVSTGGFSSRDGGIAALGGWPLHAAIMAFAFLGAVSFVWYQRIWQARRRLRHERGGFYDAEVVGLIALCLGFAALTTLTAGLAGGGDWRETLQTLPLLAVSAQTGTGFSPIEVAGLDDATKATLVVSMLIGGDLGSTAGGIKVLRLLIILRFVQLMLLRPALPPRAVVKPSLNGKTLDEADLRSALAVVTLFALVVFASWFAFLAHGYPPLDALFEVASATGTVGLSTGLARPELEPALKVILMLDMWMGRLEVIAVLILFHPRTWLGRRSPAS